VSLESDSAGQLDFPASVTIPAGQRSQTFDVAVIDNAVVDGDRVVDLLATKAAYGSGSASVLVLDDDVEVTLSLSRDVVSEIDSRVTIHAEDLGARIASDSADNGSVGSGGFSSGPVFLNNDFNPTYGSWSGWSVSNSTDVTTPGYLNQYSAISGGGALDSSTYFVASAYGYPSLPTITVSEGFAVDSLLVTNTTYAGLSIQEGDAFAKKFGGATGDDPDYFLLTIEGFDSSSDSVGTVDFYLADYRFADNSQDYLVRDWSLVDVSSLSSASSLVFSLTSSDSGAYGMNTPAYFAIDQLVLADSRPSPASLTVSRSGEDLGLPLAVELNVDSTEVQLPSEVLIPSGSSSLEVPVFIAADGVADGDQVVSIVAEAVGHIGAAAVLTVEDDDAAVLTLTLSAESFDETAGSFGGLVHRNSGDLSFPLDVSLESDSAGQLDFPASVTIPAGQRSQTFDVAVIDNEYRDGNRNVQVRSTAENYGSSDALVEVVDDEISAILVFETNGGVALSEDLGVDGFEVTLASRPQSDVLINVDLFDWPIGPSDVNLDQSQVIFTAENWNVPRAVSLTGIPDLLIEGEEAGTVRLRVDIANSDPMFSGTPHNVLPVVVFDWQPNTLEISEDASEVFLADSSSAIRLLTGSHADGLNVVANDLPQSIVIEPLSDTTGPVEIDLRGGADRVELNGANFTRLIGGAGIDRLVVNAETTLELLDYINGRVFGFEDYVLQSQGDATIQVDLNSLGQFAASGEASVLNLHVQSGDQFQVLGDGAYASPEMVGGQFAQVIVSSEGSLRVVSERPWQNVVLSRDVNYNGKISVADSLAVLNHLLAHGSELPATPTLADFRGIFPDVSGNGLVTALDSLLVLNRLALVHGAEGEGIWVPWLVESTNTSETADSQTLRLEECLPTVEQSPLKVVLMSHAADQAILDLYSSPDATDDVVGDEVNRDEEGQSVWELVGSNLT